MSNPRQIGRAIDDTDVGSGEQDAKAVVLDILANPSQRNEAGTSEGAGNPKQDVEPSLSGHSGSVSRGIFWWAILCVCLLPLIVFVLVNQQGAEWEFLEETLRAQSPHSICKKRRVQMSSVQSVPVCATGSISTIPPDRNGTRLRNPPRPDSKICQLPDGATWALAKPYKRNEFWQAVYAHDDIVSSGIRGRGFWEMRGPEDLGVTQAGTFLDVGANIGAWTFMFAAAGHCVVAVEPMAGNRLLLEATLCANSQFRDRVHIVPALLGSPENVGQVCGIYADTKNIGDGNVWCDHKIHNPNPTLTYKLYADMATVTLESVLRELQLEDINTFKMDTEGSECAVLKGASSLAHQCSITYARVETTFPGTSECVSKWGIENDFEVGALGGDTVLTRYPKSNSWV